MCAVVRDDEQFEKLCRMIEAYFQMGGIHVQLNYISREELLAAQKEPEKYSHLKVRVSGYSASFVTLSAPLQQDILERTVIGK